MLLRDLKKQSGPFVADGAMGTYYSQLTGLPASRCEIANIQQPECIAGIHRNYLEAGARLVRTNTFSANTLALGPVSYTHLDVYKRQVPYLPGHHQKGTGHRVYLAGLAVVDEGLPVSPVFPAFRMALIHPQIII